MPEVCVKLLVEHGAVTKQNDDSTPLMFAAQHGHNEIVRYLIGKGADPTFTGKHGFSAVGFAQQNNLVETEMILLGKK
jgi:ankyrin repeat protein